MRRAIFAAAVMVLAGGSAWSQTPGPFDNATICRAAIGAVMGRDPKIVRVTKTEDDVIFLRYTRQNDGTVWSYRCRIDGSRVFWASEPGGRWRNSAADETVTYRVDQKGQQLTITERYTDGSANEKSFKRSQL